MESIFTELRTVSDDLTSTLVEQNWDVDTILTFDRTDLLELLPGEKNLIIRKKAFNIICNYKKLAQKSPNSSESTPSISPTRQIEPSTPSLSTPSPSTPQLHFNVASRQIIPSKPVFQFYTDDELKEAEGKESMKPHLVNRLVQSMISNMISETQSLPTPRYPNFQEVKEVTDVLASIYPGVNKSLLLCKMKRRLQNVRPTKKAQGKVPQRSKYFKQQIEDAASCKEIENPPAPASPNNNTSCPTYDTLPLCCEDQNLSLQDHYQSEDETLSDKVEDIFMHRHIESLTKEMEKKVPDNIKVDYYMDLAFDCRTNMIRSERLTNRLPLIQQKFQALCNPIQMVQEVRRLIDFENKNFVEETQGRLDRFIQCLTFYAFSKKELVSSLMGSTSNTEDQLLALLNIIDRIFDKKKKKEVRKKVSSAIYILEGTQDPQEIQRKQANNGMPCLVLERKSKKSFTLVGNQIMCSSNDVKLGFLAFVSSFYVLDVEYPHEMAVAFTLLHHVVFLDNRIEKSIKEDFKILWPELKVYFPEVEINIDRL